MPKASICNNGRTVMFRHPRIPGPGSGGKVVQRGLGRFHPVDRTLIVLDLDRLLLSAPPSPADAPPCHPQALRMYFEPMGLWREPRELPQQRHDRRRQEQLAAENLRLTTLLLRRDAELARLKTALAGLARGISTHAGRAGNDGDAA